MGLGGAGVSNWANTSSGVALGVSAGTFEAFLQGLAATDPDMTYYNPSAIRDSFDGGDYWKWRSTSSIARTADGLHENALGYEENVGTAGEAITQAGGTFASTLRTLVQAFE